LGMESCNFKTGNSKLAAASWLILLKSIIMEVKLILKLPCPQVQDS